MLNVLNAQNPNMDRLFASAVVHHQAGRLAQAEQLYRQILAEHPSHADAVHLLGVIACQVDNHAMAIQLISQAIALNGGNAAFHSNLGEAYRKAGRFDLAEQALLQALSLDPNLADAMTNLAVLYLQQDRLEETVNVLQRVMQRAPAIPHIRLLADALAQQGKRVEAITAYEQLLRADPNDEGTLFNAAILYADLGRNRQAIDALRRCLIRRPNDIGARMKLAEVLSRTGDLQSCVNELHQVIAREPENGSAHAALANALRTCDLVDEAIAEYREAIRLNPADPVPAANMAFGLRDQARLAESIAVLRALLEKHPAASAIRSGLIFTMHLDPTVSQEDITREQQLWNDLYVTQLQPLHKPLLNDRSPDRRLRIGYVSPDFRSHPVGRFMVPLIRNHDRAQAEIYCYSCTPAPDPYTKMIEQAADQWRYAAPMNDEQLADVVRADKIDVLVDLSNHTIGNRMVLFGIKPAPVQITYLAYCAGTGLRTIDWRITDAYIDPPGNHAPGLCDEAAFERPLRLPETYWCYAPHEDAGDLSPLPMLSRGHVTFGSFNYFSKCNDQVLAFWAQLLREIPESRFMLHVPAGSRHEYVRQFFQSRGVASSRLDLVPRTNEKVYFSRYEHIDIALDPFPWAGGTTTCDAIWKGVPVITLAGMQTISRGGASILSNLGFPEWIARTPEQYIAHARALAGNVDHLQQLRGTLRERMQQSVLMDAPRFARRVDEAYRRAWHAWCAAR